MSLDIRPDPAHPHGGYAVLTLEAAQLPEAETTVSVYDSFSERHLGETDWQPEPVAFGPYPVTRSGDQASVQIGPEIVNQIEEYAVLRITIGPVTEQVSWPDTIVPRAGAAALGGIQSASKAEVQDEAPVLKVDPDPAPDPEETGEPEADETPEDDLVDDGAGADPAPPSRLPVLLGATVVLAALAGGLWLYLPQLTGEDPAEPAPVAAATPTDAPAPEDPCDTARLASLTGSWSDVETTLRGCAGSTSTDTALILIENAAAADDPDALFLFGALYDGTVEIPDFETTMDLSFEDAPAQAAEYYYRARQAGSTDAAAPLAAICARLTDATDTLSQSAREDYCSET